MALRALLLKTVASLPDGCGPTTKSILRGTARRHGYLDSFDKVFRSQLDAGELVMYGTRKGAVYGLPGQRPKRSAK